MVEAICPQCGNRMRGPDHMAGLLTHCTDCGQQVMLSFPSAAPRWDDRPGQTPRPPRRRKAPRPFTYQAAGAPGGYTARRRYARHEVSFPVRIRSLSKSPYSGPRSAVTVDLSGGGAGLLTSDAFPEHTMLDLEIALPGSVGKIAVTAEVVHTRDTDQGRFLGCEFLGADPGLLYVVNEALDRARDDGDDSSGGDAA
jgi:hypothetical protein